jgi:hypothetical protein
METDRISVIISSIEDDLKELRHLVSQFQDGPERLLKQRAYQADYYMTNRDRLLERSREYYKNMSPEKKKKILEEAKIKRLEARARKLAAKTAEVNKYLQETSSSSRVITSQ